MAPLSREAQCTKHLRAGPIFEVQMSCGKMARRREAFSSENVQNTSIADRFLLFRCQKMARRCRAKRISNSKCQKTDGLGPLFEAPMYKNSAPRGAKHVCNSKCQKKTMGSGHFFKFRCRKRHAAVARSAFASQNALNTCVLEHFGAYDVEKVSDRRDRKVELKISQ